MKALLNIIAAVLAYEFVFRATLLAQQSGEKPEELKVLGQYVGDWTSEVLSKPAVWTPTARKFQTSNHAEFVLDGWFLQHIEVNHAIGNPQQTTKAIWIQTFDPRARQYVNWFFQSSGIYGGSSGEWNPTSKTISFESLEPANNTTDQHSETFSDKDTIDGAFLVTGSDRTRMFDMEWTRKRQARPAGKPLQTQWSEIGKPIQPIPVEAKKLDPFIGEWASEFVHRSSSSSPNGGTSTGTMTVKQILDGRFLLFDTQVGNHQSKSIVGFDTNKNAYRYIRFTNMGQIDESTGRWDEKRRSFVWKLANLPAGHKRTSTTRLMGTDSIIHEVRAEDNDGKVLIDLSIRSTRKK